MKKIIREIKEQGIVQVTIADERWYIKEVPSEKTKSIDIITVPSVTWICSYYPKGIQFYKWLAEKGWDEAEAIKSAAGDKGSKVHYAITDLISGKTVKMTDMYLNPTTEKAEELTLEEYDCLLSFKQFCDDYKPIFLFNEVTVFNHERNYAGTVDLIASIKNLEGDYFNWLIDFKTGQNVWKEHELQVSAYKHALNFPDFDNININLGILQLGYRRNKKRYKLTQIEDKFDLFLGAQKVWSEENKNTEVFKKDYPVEISLKKGDEDVKTASEKL